jgi:hypothetical protein
VGNCGLDASGLVQGPVAVSCEHGNETVASISGDKFIVNALKMTDLH